MRKLTLIRNARQLLTLRGPNAPRRGSDLGNLGIIQDGAMLVADGRIVEVGPSRRVENLAQARSADEIDASGCVVMPGFVDCAVRLTNHSLELSPRALTNLAVHRIEEAIRYGTTALGALIGPDLPETGALKLLRVHAELRELSLTLTSTLAISGAQFLANPRLRKLADFVEASEESLLREAEKLSWNCKTPASVVTPIVWFLAGETLASARPLIERGALVALASGAKPGNMQTAIALACSHLGMSAAEAVTAATINGAHAMGRGNQIGSIECGKHADFVILGVPDYREIPYHFGVNLVKLVMIRGTVRAQRAAVRWP